MKLNWPVLKDAKWLVFQLTSLFDGYGWIRFSDYRKSFLGSVYYFFVDTDTSGYE